MQIGAVSLKNICSRLFNLGSILDLDQTSIEWEVEKSKGVGVGLETCPDGCRENFDIITLQSLN